VITVTSAHRPCRSAHPDRRSPTATGRAHTVAPEAAVDGDAGGAPVTSSETARTGPTPPTPEAYSRMDRDPRFVELRRRFRNFVFPMTVVFLAWYLLYVLLSAFGRSFMDAKIVGNLNVAFFFGLLQFVSTFVIAWAYSRFADTRIDPLAKELHDEMMSGRVEETP
jgi:uncharacterized membrane protein (DUF485 family)